MVVDGAGGVLKACEAWQVPKRTLANYLSGESEPKATFLAKVADAAEVSIDWLVGRAERVQEVAQSLVVGGAQDALAHPEDFALLPRRDVRASAGSGATVYSEPVSEYLAFRRDWLRKLGVSPEHGELCEIGGDSMADTIPDGSIVLIDTAAVQVANGFIYAFRREDELFVKRVQQRLDGTVLLISDNDRYETETVPPEKVADLHVIGRIMWVAHEV